MPELRYDERTGLYVGVPEMIVPPTRPLPTLTREQKIAWALAYIQGKFKCSG